MLPLELWGLRSDGNLCIKGNDNGIVVHPSAVDDIPLCNVLSRLDYEVWVDQ